MFTYYLVLLTQYLLYIVYILPCFVYSAPHVHYLHITLFCMYSTSCTFFTYYLVLVIYTVPTRTLFTYYIVLFTQYRLYIVYILPCFGYTVPPVHCLYITLFCLHSTSCTLSTYYLFLHSTSRTLFTYYLVLFTQYRPYIVDNLDSSCWNSFLKIFSDIIIFHKSRNLSY